MKLLVEAGYACQDYHDNVVRNVPAWRIQCDEIWSFLYSMDKALDRGRVKSPPEEAGSIWTWTGIEQYTKLMVTWLVSPTRSQEPATEFMKDLRSRVSRGSNPPGTVSLGPPPRS